MQAAEIRELSTSEIVTKLDQAREEQRNLRFQRRTGQLTNLARPRELKRDIARMETILRERELAGAQGTPAPEAEEG